MSDIVLRTAVKAQNAPVALAAAARQALVRLREEEGQDMVEYAGVLVVVAAIIAAVVAIATTTIGPDLSKGVDHVINGIFGSGSGSGGH